MKIKVDFFINRIRMWQKALVGENVFLVTKPHHNHNSFIIFFFVNIQSLLICFSLEVLFV